MADFPVVTVIPDPKTFVLPKTEFIEIHCPACHGKIWVQKGELNCGIFRHAVYLLSGQPISPHATKEECEELIRKNLILGCAQPFQVRRKPNDSENDNPTGSEGEKEEYEAVSCGYI